MIWRISYLIRGPSICSCYDLVHLLVSGFYFHLFLLHVGPTCQKNMFHFWESCPILLVSASMLPRRLFFLFPISSLWCQPRWRDSRVSQVFYLISSHCCHWILSFCVFPFSRCLFSKKPKTYIFCWLYHISNNILNILYLYISICWLWQLVEFTMIISLSIPCFILSLDILWLHCEYLLSFFSMHSARQL